MGDATILRTPLGRRVKGWNRLPQGDLLVWPVGHHFPHLHNPARFAELITAFMAALPTPR